MRYSCTVFVFFSVRFGMETYFLAGDMLNANRDRTRGPLITPFHGLDDISSCQMPIVHIGVIFNAMKLREKYCGRMLQGDCEYRGFTWLGVGCAFSSTLLFSQSDFFPGCSVCLKNSRIICVHLPPP